VRAVAQTQDAVMGEIVNLRQVKKRRERDEASALAKQNRVRHGRTKTERVNDERIEERRQTLLDASRRGETDE
jgi:uncharacterized protein DUF4169